jgi:hypothetical protein
MKKIVTLLLGCLAFPAIVLAADGGATNPGRPDGIHFAISYDGRVIDDTSFDVSDEFLQETNRFHGSNPTNVPPQVAAAYPHLRQQEGSAISMGRTSPNTYRVELHASAVGSAQGASEIDAQWAGSITLNSGDKFNVPLGLGWTATISRPE